MTEAENQNVDQEIVSPSVEDVAQMQSQPNESVEVDQGQAQEGQPESDKEYNFRQMRESNARLQSQLEQERIEREQFQRGMEDKLASHLSPQKEEEVDELADLDDDDWATRKHVQKLARREAQEIMKNALAEQDQKRIQRELPDRLKSQHQDFESVVTKENVEYLRATKPHIAAALASHKDPYAQALAVYDAIKAFGPSDQVLEDEARMKKNASRPGTLGAAQAPSPLTEVKALERGLSSSMKLKYQQEMIAAIRGS